MPFVPPWIQAPDVLGAIRAGSGVGLQIREQNTADAVAAQRLRQAQDEMFLKAQQQSIDSAAQAERLRQTQQELFQRAQKAQAENDIRQQQLSQQQQEQNAILGLKQSEEGRQQNLFNQQAKFAETVRNMPLPGGPEFEALSPQDKKAALEARDQSLLQQAPQDVLPKLLEMQQAERQRREDRMMMMQGMQNRMLLQGAQRLENSTGLPVLDESGMAIDPAKKAAALEFSNKQAKYKMTAPQLRAAEQEIANMELETGKTFSPEERAQAINVLATYGNKNPTLEADTRSKLNVAEYAVSSASQLLDEVTNNPKVKYGPGRFKLDQKTGEWLGGDPEASKIGQLYNTLFAKQAFTQGGKQLTATEIEQIKAQIGNPSDANFVSKLKTALGQYTQDLGRNVRDLQSRHLDLFPGYRDEISRWVNQYQTTKDKYGVKTSPNFPEPLRSSGFTASSPTAIPPATERKVGQPYTNQFGVTKIWTGTGWK